MSERIPNALDQGAKAILSLKVSPMLSININIRLPDHCSVFQAELFEIMEAPRDCSASTAAA